MTPRPTNPAPRRATHSAARRGLTLLELLLAISVTVTIGFALAIVMTSVARGLIGAGESRSALQRAHAAFIRLRSYTEPALCLLQHKPGEGFALWLDDTRANQAVNLTELRAFWHDPQSGLLDVEYVRFPAEWPQSLRDSTDITLSAESDFLAEMEAQRALGLTVRETIADGVLDITLEHTSLTPQESQRFHTNLLLDAGLQDPMTVVSHFALLFHETPR
jgi:hypothetical protein